MFDTLLIHHRVVLILCMPQSYNIGYVHQIIVLILCQIVYSELQVSYMEGI